MKKFILTCTLTLALFSSMQAVPTVVAIHGVLASFRTMYPIKKVVEATGCFDVCLYRFDTRKHCLSKLGCQLNERLKCIAAEKPGEPIDFVAHSIGSLVLRAALACPDCPAEAKIGRIILLAPTNKGAYLARRFRNFLPVSIALGDKSGKELMTYTEEDIICHFGSFPPSAQVLVIAGCKGIHPYFQGCPNDGYLAVEETYLNTPHTHRVLPLTHGEVLTNCYSLRLIREFLLYGVDN
jgi:hypothetical protein